MSEDLVESLQQLLHTNILGRAHEHHAELVSTNDRAVDWAQNGGPHGAVVTARTQTAGRGRRGRPWFSAAADRVTNVYASLILRPGGRSDDVGAVGLAVALGLCDGLDTFGVDPTIKWPNDILVAGRKLAGILCEARWTTAAPVIVAGFGINVAQDEFPPELADRAIALGPAIDPAVVLARCLDALEPVLEEFWADGFAPLRPRFERRCPWLGRAVEVELAPGERYVVRALEVDDHGALWVEHEGGEHHRICAGEIVEV